MTRKEPQVIDWLMDNARNIPPGPVESLAAFKAVYDEGTRSFDPSIDRAVAGGFLADRVAYAFAAGYEAALRRLVPNLPNGPIVSLCVSEAGGAHPRAIKTRLEKGPSGGHTLTGQKSFITAALEAEILLVAASAGTGGDGKNLIRMVTVARNAAGITVAPMPDLPFVPEISHGTVSFAAVPGRDRDILPGDGYTDYIKPFRTIEDIHVLGAVMGYLVRAALLFSWPREVCQRLLAQSGAIAALAAADPLSPGTHLALAGLVDCFDRLVIDTGPLWDRADAGTRERWTWDRGLLGVAEKARTARLSAAWSRVIRD